MHAQQQALIAPIVLRCGVGDVRVRRGRRSPERWRLLGPPARISREPAVIRRLFSWISMRDRRRPTPTPMEGTSMHRIPTTSIS
jgi:hypothetical protein